MRAYYDFKATEFSPYHTSVRFDVIAIARAKRISRIIEVKSCRADYLSDKKWKSYLPFATHFYFAAPAGAIKPEELPQKIGLIEFIKQENEFIVPQYTKLCKSIGKLSDDNYIKLIEGAFVRLKHELDERDKKNNYDDSKTEWQ